MVVSPLKTPGLRSATPPDPPPLSSDSSFQYCSTNITQRRTQGRGKGGEEGRSAAKMSRVMKSTALLFICFPTVSLPLSFSLFEFFPLRSLSPLFRGRPPSPLQPAPLSLPLKNQLRETILGTRSEPTN